MVEVLEIDYRAGGVEPGVRERALETLENGGVVFLPGFSFELAERERAFLDPATVSPRYRNHGYARIIFDPASKKCRRSALKGAARRDLEAMMARFTEWTRHLVFDLLPRYTSALETGPGDYRLCERRNQGLHVDSFFFLPTQGRGILRVFANVNPEGRPRVWQVGGEPFEPFAKRFLPRVRRAVPGGGWLLDRLGITNGRRTAYDDAMRQLRGLLKKDVEYRRTVPPEVVEFPAGSTWFTFTDLVLHSGMAGQHAFDQTFLLPVGAMREPARSSLRILERLLGRALA